MQNKHFQRIKNEYLKGIAKYDIERQLVLFTTLVCCCKEANFKDIQHYLTLAAQADPESIRVKCYQCLIAVLMGNTDLYHNIRTEMSDIDKDFLENFFLQYNLIYEFIPDDPIAISNFDQKRIHAYFQQQKEREFSTITSNILKKTVNPTWAIPDHNKKTSGCYSYSVTDEQSEVVSLKYAPDIHKNSFAMIEPELQDKLEKITLKQFKIALPKVCSRKCHVNGIKFLENRLIELKINGDIRLYTDKVFCNPNDEILIIFNNVGNHRDVRLKLEEKRDKKQTLTIENVPSVAEAATKTQSDFFAKKQDNKKKATIASSVSIKSSSVSR